MNTSKKDLWDSMYPNAEQLLAEALAKTDEEVAESLQAKGYDLAVLDEQLMGLIERLPPYKPAKAKKGFLAVRVAAAAGAMSAMGGGIYAYVVATAAPVVTAGAILATAAAAPPSLPTASAATMREEALSDCAASRWQPCLDKLGEARDLDPAGDSDARVQSARANAVRALRGGNR